MKLSREQQDTAIRAANEAYGLVVGTTEPAVPKPAETKPQPDLSALAKHQPKPKPKPQPTKTRQERSRFAKMFQPKKPKTVKPTPDGERPHIEDVIPGMTIQYNKPIPGDAHYTRIDYRKRGNRDTDKITGPAIVENNEKKAALYTEKETWEREHPGGRFVRDSDPPERGEVPDAEAARIAEVLERREWEADPNHAGYKFVRGTDPGPRPPGETPNWPQE